MSTRRALACFLVVALAVLVVAAPASAAKPKKGSWFSDLLDDDNPSSIQFKVRKKGKALKKLTIFWRCENRSGYHNFRNPPFPIGINKKKKFKVIGATTPPAGQSTKDFKLKGKFTSRKKARYSMKLKGCGPKTKGKLRHQSSIERPRAVS